MATTLNSFLKNIIKQYINYEKWTEFQKLWNEWVTFFEIFFYILTIITSEEADENS